MDVVAGEKAGGCVFAYTKEDLKRFLFQGGWAWASLGVVLFSYLDCSMCRNVDSHELDLKSVS